MLRLSDLSRRRLSFRDRVKHLARLATSVISCSSGLASLLMRMADLPRARILAYHGISETPHDVFDVSRGDFEEQMRLLMMHFRVISLEDLVGGLRGHAPIRPGSVVVTFDDGYEDIYRHAFPVLRRYQIPATVFVIVDRLRDEADGSRISRAGNLERLFLSWRQIHEMAADGISFGSHTLTHRSLASLSSAECRREVASSKFILEQRLGRPVTALAYPFGTARAFNAETRRIVQEAGYACALSAQNGLNGSRTDLYELRRTKIERDDGMFIFTRALNGGLDPWVLVDRFGWFLQRTK